MICQCCGRDTDVNGNCDYCDYLGRRARKSRVKPRHNSNRRDKDGTDDYESSDDNRYHHER